MAKRRAISSLVPYTTPYIGNNVAPYGYPPYGDIENPRVSPEYYRTLTGLPRDYYNELRQCRYFYRYDPMASTVINRMCEIAVSSIINRKVNCSDEEIIFFDAIAKKLNPLLESMALEYLIAGMAVPDYVKDRIMGSRLDSRLGRTRFVYPKTFWIRNPENIVIRRMPITLGRAVYLEVPTSEQHFIRNKGEYPDGSKDVELFNRIKEQFPDYVQRVLNGDSVIPLPDARPVFRKLMPTQDYPQPFLVPALAALKHKQQIKRMDYSIASKMLGAIRQVKVGDKDDPVEEDDGRLEQVRDQMSAQAEGNDSIYTLYTDHTVEIGWVYPPLDALLSENKYLEPNADIFFAFGFSKVLLVGESGRSNTNTAGTSMLGPLATLNEIRRALLNWVSDLYIELANDNGFVNVPEPDFTIMQTGDLASLATFAMQAVQAGALSKDTIARLLGSSFQREQQQIDAERASTGLPDVATENQTKVQNDQMMFDQQLENMKQKSTPDQNSGG